jgi:hypothetical protein
MVIWKAYRFPFTWRRKAENGHRNEEENAESQLLVAPSKYHITDVNKQSEEIHGSEPNRSKPIHLH